MFPHVMIVASLIFFSGEFHQKIINKITFWFRIDSKFLESEKAYLAPKITKHIFLVFFVFQLLFPFRYLAYPNELFWTEEGYRFSWRVMLMEKAGYTQFTVLDSSGKKIVVNNNDFLTKLQEKMMSTQADMMLQYAHFLRGYYANKGFDKPQVYVDSYIALNGRIGKPLVSPSTDLAKIKDSFHHKSWILPFNDTIKGF